MDDAPTCRLCWKRSQTRKIQERSQLRDESFKGSRYSERVDSRINSNGGKVEATSRTNSNATLNGGKVQEATLSRSPPSSNNSLKYSKDPEERKRQIRAERHRVEKEEASGGSTEAFVSKPVSKPPASRAPVSPPVKLKFTPPPEPPPPPSLELLTARLTDALDSRKFNELEQLLHEIQEADGTATPEQKSLIKRAKQALSKETARLATRNQRHAARKERRWDPALKMAVNLEQMIDKYAAQSDPRSRNELTAYYNTLKEQA